MEPSGKFLTEMAAGQWFAATAAVLVFVVAFYLFEESGLRPSLGARLDPIIDKTAFAMLVVLSPLCLGLAMCLMMLVGFSIHRN